MGYFNAQQIKTCEENGITAYVSEPDKTNQASLLGRYSKDDFQYDAQVNVYRCPGNQVLKYSSSMNKNGKTIWMYRSSVPVCAVCALKSKCLPAKSGCRTVSHWEHEAIIENHRQRMAKDGAEKMRQRAGLCEHPFGTLKLWCGWTHFLMRGLEKVKAEMSLLMLSYNFKRVLSILSPALFRAYCLSRRLNRPILSS